MTKFVSVAAHDDTSSATDILCVYLIKLVLIEPIMLNKDHQKQAKHILILLLLTCCAFKVVKVRHMSGFGE